MSSSNRSMHVPPPSTRGGGTFRGGHHRRGGRTTTTTTSTTSRGGGWIPHRERPHPDIATTSREAEVARPTKDREINKCYFCGKTFESPLALRVHEIEHRRVPWLQVGAGPWPWSQLAVGAPDMEPESAFEELPLPLRPIRPGTVNRRATLARLEYEAAATVRSVLEMLEL